MLRVVLANILASIALSSNCIFEDHGTVYDLTGLIIACLSKFDSSESNVDIIEIFVNTYLQAFLARL
jgi:hypothetical protein